MKFPVIYCNFPYFIKNPCYSLGFYQIPLNFPHFIKNPLHFLEIASIHPKLLLNLMLFVATFLFAP